MRALTVSEVHAVSGGGKVDELSHTMWKIDPSSMGWSTQSMTFGRPEFFTLGGVVGMVVDPEVSAGRVVAAVGIGTTGGVAGAGGAFLGATALF